MMKRVLYLSIILLGISLISFAQQKKNQVDKLLSKADSLMYFDSFEEAEKTYLLATNGFLELSKWNEYFLTKAKLIEMKARLGLFDVAQNEAKENLIEIETRKGDFKIPQASFLNQLGFIHLNKGRNEMAIESIQNAIDALNQAKNPDKLILASCYTNLGLANWNIGNREIALEHLFNALNLRVEKFSENHVQVADAYNNIGLIYSETDFDKAYGYYSKAQTIYEKFFPSSHSKITNVILNKAIIQRKQKLFTEALSNFQKVLGIWANAKIKHPKEGFVYSSVGDVYLDQNDYEKAIAFKLQALEVYKVIYAEKHPEIASIYNQLGNIYITQNKTKKALSYFQKALISNSMTFQSNDYTFNPQVTDYYNASILLQSLHAKAKALEYLFVSKSVKTGHLKIAWDTYFSADTLIEKIRNVQTNKNDKIELGKRAAEIYEDAIRLCLLLKDATIAKRKYTESAFYFSEKSKSSVLLEAISDANAKHFANLPDSLLEKEKIIKTEIAFYEQKLAEKNDGAQENRMRSKLFELNRNYEQFTKLMEAQFPEYYNLKYNVKSTSVKDLQKLLSKNTGVITYFIADQSKRVYVFYVTKNKYKLYDVAEDERLNKLIVGYRNSIKVDAQEIYLETATSLYNQLVPFKVPKSISKLIIIPDGKIGTIPFEALITKKVNLKNLNYSTLPYLINKCEISYSYSSNLLEQSLLKSEKVEGDAFLCAPIYFSKNKTPLVDLPATKDEVNKIKKMFVETGIQCKVYTGKDVQESIIKSSELMSYNYIHFATHGIVDELKPELSEIYLAPDSTKKEDGNLYSGEIYNLKINADLVTLSACQTGLGKIQKGEGIIGLSRALLFAGAKNLIVSLWSVADESTSMLMTDFYNNLLKNNKLPLYSQYMQQVKQSMIKNEKYNKPYYWAPFILIGK